jgi:5-bromo-4-chloroindolyl phosphate hydrolysis protein
MIDYSNMSKQELRNSIQIKIKNVKQFKSELRDAERDLERARKACKKAKNTESIW